MLVEDFLNQNQGMALNSLENVYVVNIGHAMSPNYF